MTTDTPRRLRDLRGDRAWTIRRLADEANVATATIVRIEGGLPARMGSILRIAQALGVEPMAIEEYREQRAREREDETTAQD